MEHLGNDVIQRMFLGIGRREGDFFRNQNCTSKHRKPLGVEYCVRLERNDAQIPLSFRAKIRQEHRELCKTDMRLMTEEGGVSWHRRGEYNPVHSKCLVALSPVCCFFKAEGGCDEKAQPSAGNRGLRMIRSTAYGSLLASHSYRILDAPHPHSWVCTRDIRPRGRDDGSACDHRASRRRACAASHRPHSRN